MAASRAGTGKVQSGLESLIVPGSKEVTKKITRHVKRTYEAAWRGSHWPNIGQFEHKSK